MGPTKWSLLLFRRNTLQESCLLQTTKTMNTKNVDTEKNIKEMKTKPKFNVYLNKISCPMSKQKNQKKRGKCHKMFCKVGNKFSFSQVVFIKIISLYLSFYSSCLFQKCLTKSKFCVATFSSIVTVPGTCNIFGVCRRGRKAQINHPACTAITNKDWAVG